MTYLRSIPGLRTVAAVAAVGVLVGGVTWRGLAAETSNSTGTAPAVQAAPAISRAALGGRESYADVVKMVAPAVVTVRTEARARVAPTRFGGDNDDTLRRFFGEQFSPGPRLPGRGAPRGPRQRALGSGVVVTNDGYILTNNHVVEDADEIRVEFNDGRDFKASLVGADKPSDLAVLKIAATHLPTVSFGDSSAVQVGDLVLALGNPLGIGQTVTMGIISAKGRSTSRGDGSYEDFLQTDAPINHGNSGGALVNLSGQLVGINSQIISPSDGNIGIGFAIPSNMAAHVMNDLKSSGRVHRAMLGVSVQPVTSDIAESLGLKAVSGAIVSEVNEGSAAARAGVRQGDVITSFNGQPVGDFNGLRNRVADMAPGASVSLGIVRDGSSKTLTVTLDEVAASKSAQNASESKVDDQAALGVAVEPLTPELAARVGLPRNARGMLVGEVNPDGRAAVAGIQAGDLIVEVNRQPVESVEALRSAIRKAADKPALLLVRRDGHETFVTVRPS